MQPSHSSNRILLPVRNWFIFVTLMLALFLNLIPVGRIPGIPDWVAVALVFWCVHQPLRVGMGTGFLLGVVMDVADGSLLGQHALAYVVLTFVAGGWSRRILWFPLTRQALHVLPMLLLSQLIMLVVRLVSGGEFPGAQWFLSSVIAVILWPPLTYLLLLPQFRPVERDDNRPI